MMTDVRFYECDMQAQSCTVADLQPARAPRQKTVRQLLRAMANYIITIL